MLSYCLVFRACINAAAVGVSEALYLTEMQPSADSYLAVFVWPFTGADLLPSNGIALVLTVFPNENIIPAWCIPVLRVM